MKQKEKLNLSELEIGQKVEYGFFTNITYEGLDDKGQVIMKDKQGNIKKVYRELFEKNARIIS